MLTFSGRPAIDKRTLDFLKENQNFKHKLKLKLECSDYKLYDVVDSRQPDIEDGEDEEQWLTCNAYTTLPTEPCTFDERVVYFLDEAQENNLINLYAQSSPEYLIVIKVLYDSSEGIFDEKLSFSHSEVDTNSGIETEIKRLNEKAHRFITDFCSRVSKLTNENVSYSREHYGNVLKLISSEVEKVFKGK